MTHLDFLELLQDIKDKRILYGMLDEKEQEEMNELFTRYNEAVFEIDDVINEYDVEKDGVKIVNEILAIMEKYQIPFRNILDFQNIICGDDDNPITMLS